MIGEVVDLGEARARRRYDDGTPGALDPEKGYAVSGQAKLVLGGITFTATVNVTALPGVHPGQLSFLARSGNVCSGNGD